eukprot:TRINITY_DN11786_c0_g2_i1.p1 TRINITY_DN11786_c0_g2~~TRINITY_DN11786_c0_g2_i1.p1  ORF type:complete len:367 (+),score=77.44 TRINITY_DN11786_c0_g2_i1:50-1102(+)
MAKKTRHRQQSAETKATAAEAATGEGKSAKAKRIWREAVPSVTEANGFHNYEVDALDHAETDIRAYQHLTPFLTLLAEELSKRAKDLKLWDGYYCKGAMIKRLAALGFPHVHNKNEDFYAVIDSGKLPEHDVFLSSPPYSNDHLERCVRFCAQSKKTWCLLLPNWVESRPYFKEALKGKESRLLFIAPVERYTYWMPADLVKGKSRPDWVGNDGGTSPYHSSWIVCMPPGMPVKKMVASLEEYLRESGEDEWVLARSMKAVRWKVKSARGDKPEPEATPGKKGKKKGKKKAAATHSPQAEEPEEQFIKTRQGKQALKKQEGKKLLLSADDVAPPAPKKRKAAWKGTVEFD